MDRDHQAPEVGEHPGDPPCEVDRGGALFLDLDGDLEHAQALALGSDHELGGEHVVVDDAAGRDRGHDRAAQGLEPVGVRAREAEARAEQAVVDLGRGPAHERALVARAGHGLAADDHVGFVAAQQRERADVELHVAQVDLLADHEFAPRPKDALSQGAAVVGLGVGEPPQLVGPALGEARGDGDGRVLAAVLGEQELEAQLGLGGLELGEEALDAGLEDRLFIIDGDHDAQLGPRALALRGVRACAGGLGGLLGFGVAHEDPCLCVASRRATASVAAAASSCPSAQWAAARPESMLSSMEL